VKRRTFLGGTLVGPLVTNSLARLAYAQRDSSTAGSSSEAAAFKTGQAHVAGNKIFYRRYGQGPAILLVHGFPRTSLMWRFLAPKLASNHTVICVDLRAYGRSAIPASADDHFPYSKRAMAQELVEVMAKLGFPAFTLIGHDRGGRVAYRLALDHPKSVERLAVFDVIPTLEAWSRSDARFAQTYWPWILLSQKEPLPESYSALPRLFFIIHSGKVRSARKFSKSTFPPTAIERGSMESAKSTVLRQRSMSSTIARIRKPRSGSNAPCCIFGPRVVRLIRSTRRKAARSAFGVSGLRARKDRP
jgi:pimeloyl-ACP methyl ester carboxylesterase